MTTAEPSKEALKRWFAKGSAYAATRILITLREMMDAGASGDKQADFLALALDRRLESFVKGGRRQAPDLQGVHRMSAADCLFPPGSPFADRCCGQQSSCALEMYRPCDADGGCWDRSTCAGCDEPRLKIVALAPTSPDNAPPPVVSMPVIPRSNLNCLRTGHPCGTDTWAEGTECGCISCQRWLGRRDGWNAALAALPPEPPLETIDKIGLVGSLMEAFAHARGHRDFLERTRNLVNAFIPDAALDKYFGDIKAGTQPGDAERLAQIREAWPERERADLGPLGNVIPFLLRLLDAAQSALARERADHELTCKMHRITISKYEELQSALAESRAEVARLRTLCDACLDAQANGEPLPAKVDAATLDLDSARLRSPTEARASARSEGQSE